MALPTLYIDTGGHAQGSGSTDSGTPTVSNTSGAAVAGSVVTVAGANLSGVLADGSQTIFINDATNSNQKVFKITAVDDALDTVTVTPAPTGSITNSAWGIGGQFVYDSLRFEGAMAPGWVAQLNNTPAAKTGSTFFTARAAGTGAAGRITLRGKTGVRPTLRVTDNRALIESNILWLFENLELDSDGAAESAVNTSSGSSGTIYRDIRIIDAGGVGFSLGNGDSSLVIGCEVTGTGQGGISAGIGLVAHGNYIHDLTGNGFNAGGANPAFISMMNIIDTVTGKGHDVTGASTSNSNAAQLFSCTTYGCGDSGLEVADVDTVVRIFNSIFSENGNAAGEYNIEYTAGTAESVGIHSHNVFFHSGGGGGANLSGLTANSTELTSDPQFVDPANGDFRLGSSSPAKAAGFPGQFLNGPLGYLDIGAVQRQEAGGGASKGKITGLLG